LGVKDQKKKKNGNAEGGFLMGTKSGQDIHTQRISKDA